MITEYTVDSIEDYVQIVTKINDDANQNHKLWFRGQKNDNPLLPKVLRTITNKKVPMEYREVFINRAFDSCYEDYVVTLDNYSSKFSFMQHYGIPTRLLDWTESSLNALFFSLEDQFSIVNDSVVWILNPEILNALTVPGRHDGSFSYLAGVVKSRFDAIGYYINGTVLDSFYKNFPDCKNFNLVFPVAFHPKTSKNLRITAQKGVFLLWGASYKSLQEIVEETKVQNCLHKIKINSVARSKIYKSLEIMGINETSVYPDIYGLAKELCSEKYLQKQETDS